MSVEATTSWEGRTLDGGRYRVLAKLGEGGMGSVYRARDARLAADVVIKVPRPALLAEPDFAARFAREINALVQLAHPHIVKVSDVGKADGLPFCVMQYLPGGSLEDRRPRGPDGQPLPLSAHTLAGWLTGTAQALDYIHKKGLIHRDIKPANILFDADGHPFVSDFGIAKVAAERETGKGLTGAGMVLGTPEYLAPELILGKPYDGRVDQYALAVAVYELIAGLPPFVGASPHAVLILHTTQAPKPLTQVVPDIPESLWAAVARGLAKEPKDRFPTCIAFAEAVRAAVAEMPEPADDLLEPAAMPVAEVLKIPCPTCQKILRVPPKARGKRIACPFCKGTIPVLPDVPVAGTPTQASKDTTRQQTRTTPGAPQRAFTGPTGSRPAAAPKPRSRRKALIIGLLALILIVGGAGAAWWQWDALQGLFGMAPAKPSPTATSPESPEKPSVELRADEELELQSGEHKDFTVAVERHGFDGPVHIRIRGLPVRVRAPAGVTIAAGQDGATIRFTAEADAREIEREIELVVDEPPATHAIRLRVHKERIAPGGAPRQNTPGKPSGGKPGSSPPAKPKRPPSSSVLSPGLVMELFTDTNFATRIKAAIDPQPNHRWDDLCPDDDLPPGPFTARWTGWVRAPKTGRYKLTLACDGGARLWFGNDNHPPVIDMWTGWSGKGAGPPAQVEFAEDEPYLLKLEFIERGKAPSSVQLSWEGEAGEVGHQPVPADALFHETVLFDAARAAVVVPKDAAFYLRRAAGFVARKNDDRAEADFTRAVEIAPDNANTYFQRAELYLRRKEDRRAIADLGEAIRLKPDWHEPVCQRGRLLRTDRRFEQAVDDFKQAIKLNEKCPIAQRELAWILATCPYDRLRNGSQALLHARRASDLPGSKGPEFLETLAAAYAENGNFPKATETQKKAVDQTEDPVARAAARRRLDQYKKDKAYRDEGN